MSDPVRAYLAEAAERARRHADVLDTGGTELALVGTDIERLVQMLRRCVEAMDQARRESASEPKSVYARAATIILNTALTDLAALCERGKG